jgi:hypothetical protein
VLILSKLLNQGQVSRIEMNSDLTPRMHNAKFQHLVPILLFAAILLGGCTQKPSEPQQVVAVTRPVGSWQGRGTATVGDIPSETGRFHIVWRTSNESPAGTGTFKLTLRSAVSGRTLGIVADHKGVGTGTAEYDEGPRTYDFLVESTNVDWSFKVEETSGAYTKGGRLP